MTARMAVLVGAAVIAVAVFVVGHLPPRPVIEIQVVTVKSTGCGAFGNLTCHLIGTSDGRVIDIMDDSWIFIQPGLCYRIALSRLGGEEGSNATQVACK